MAAEKQFENKIKKYLTDRGYWLIKYWGGAKYTKSGIPDILASINGYFVAIEVKGPTGKPSKLQLYEIRKIRESGGIGIILYPESFELFKELCDNLEDEKWMLAEDCQKRIDTALKITEKERGVLYGKKCRS